MNFEAVWDAGQKLLELASSLSEMAGFVLRQSRLELGVQLFAIHLFAIQLLAVQILWLAWLSGGKGCAKQSGANQKGAKNRQLRPGPLAHSPPPKIVA
jgi:hypothetical protein